MAFSGERLFTPEERYEKARAVWARYFTGTTAIHYGYKQVSDEERLKVSQNRAVADIAMGIMQRAQRAMK